MQHSMGTRGRSQSGARPVEAGQLKVGTGRMKRGESGGQKVLDTVVVPHGSLAQHAGSSLATCVSCQRL